MNKVAELRLSRSDLRHLFGLLGIDLVNRRPNDSGWINHLYRPNSLGQDRNPSFSVSLRTGAVKDFGGDYSNDLPGLVMDVLRLTFSEAMAWIERQSRQSAVPAPVLSRRPKPCLPALDIDEALDACERVLTASDEASTALLTYLREVRGLSDEAIRNRGLGIVRTQGRTWLHIPFRTHGDEVSHYKLIAFDVGGGTWQRNHKNKIVLTRGETVLYMADQANHFPDELLVLCEGELDAILARQYGFNSVTGTGGAGTFKQEWAEEIKSLPQSDKGITIAYDADGDGLLGARKAAETLSRVGVPVRVAVLPESKDVSDVLRER